MDGIAADGSGLGAGAGVAVSASTDGDRDQGAGVCIALDTASSIVVAGAATTPPSRSSGAVSRPHPATTTVDTMRPITPSPKADLPCATTP